MDTQISKRNNYFDFLRAIAIIFVMANHTTFLADLDMSDGFNMDVLFLQIFKTAVPVFLAISGYFLCNKKISGCKEYFKFEKKHFIRVYIPLLLFSIPYIFESPITMHLLCVRTFFALLGAYSVYYFIFLIVQYYLLLPFIKRLTPPYSKKCWGLIVSSVISAIAICYITYLLSIKAMEIPLFLYAGLFPVWIVFFALGCYLGANKHIKFNITIISVLCIITLAFSYLESYYLSTRYSGGYGIKLSVFVFSFCCIILVFSRQLQDYYSRNENFFTSIMSKIGRLSLVIYLLHPYVIDILCSQKLIFSTWFLGIVEVSVISILTVYILALILPKRIGQFIGF